MNLGRPAEAALLAASIACALPAVALSANAHGAAARPPHAVVRGTVTRQSLRRRWIAANLASIARIRNAKMRAKAHREFEATLARSTVPVVASRRLPDLRAAAARELALPGRYDLAPPSAPRGPSLAARFLRWIGGLLGRALRAVFGRARLSDRAASAIGDVLFALFIVVAVAAMVFVLARVRIERASRVRDACESIERPRDAHALYLHALELARSGAYAKAVRTLFAAATLALALRGVVADDASATVGELRRALRGSATALLAPFDRVAGAFVAAAYAETPVGSEDWQRACDGYRELAEETR